MQYSAKMTDAVIAEIERQHYDELKEYAKVHRITKNGRDRWLARDMEQKKRALRGPKSRLLRAWEKIVNAYALVMAVLMTMGLFVWEGESPTSASNSGGFAARTRDAGRAAGRADTWEGDEK